MNIDEWFKTMDYAAGVAIYKTLPNAKSRTIASLSRGKNDRNMAVLIGELRKAKNARPAPEEKKKPVGMIDRNDINLNPPEPNKY